jgi:hypothetical protein
MWMAAKPPVTDRNLAARLIQSCRPSRALLKTLLLIRVFADRGGSKRISKRLPMPFMRERLRRSKIAQKYFDVVAATFEGTPVGHRATAL